MKIGLLGYGTVGRSVHELINSLNLGVSVKAIWRRPGSTPKTELDTCDVEAIINDPDIDVIVEVLAGAQPAARLIAKALEAGKHVVTANKAALAAQWAELTQLAYQHQRHLRFEASVAGGIPVIEALTDLRRVDTISQLSGIVNGTSNFILSAMMTQGMPFADALAQAQALGYAEADPTADIEGIDVKNKTIIATNVAFQTQIEHDFPVLGISAITAQSIHRARERGHVIRHMMLVCREKNRLGVGVAPMSLPVTHLAAHVGANLNFVAATGSVVGNLTWTGPGAGGHPTADAILHDLLTITRQRPVNYVGTNPLTLDNSLLVGTAHFEDGSVESITLHEAILTAKRTGGSMAFTPSGV